MPLIPSYLIRNIAILAAKNQTALVDYLMPSSEHPKQGVLIAINAEKVITIESDPTLRHLIASAEYKYADGISIVKSIRQKYLGAEVVRIAGADLWQALMARAGELQIPVFLVGSSPDVLSQSVNKAKQLWGVNIVGSADGYFSDEERTALFARIRDSGAKFVSVALGSPKQELFMRDCQEHYKDALYMGVGGTYDVFTGRVKRAPKLWQQLGLEWLYRLLCQPTRWRRQVKLLRYAFYYFTRRL